MHGTLQSMVVLNLCFSRVSLLLVVSPLERGAVRGGVGEMVLCTSYKVKYDSLVQ